MARIISESIVVQFGFVIFILSLVSERNEAFFSSIFLRISVYVQQHFPNKLSLAVVSLRRGFQIVMHNRVPFLFRHLGHGCEALSVIHPCDDIFKCHLTVVAFPPHIVCHKSWAFIILALPLVQQHVTVPAEHSRRSVGCLCRASAQRVVFECHGLSLRRDDALQHTVCQPRVAGVYRLPCLRIVRFCFLTSREDAQEAVPCLCLRCFCQIPPATVYS